MMLASGGQPPSIWVRIVAWLALFAAWVAFFVLAVGVAQRLSRFNGAATSPTQVAYIAESPGGSAPSDSFRNTDPRPTSPAWKASPPPATAVLVTPNATPVSSGYTTRCEHSLPTRLQPGVSGHTSPNEWVKLRADPGAAAGTNLAYGTHFVTTGQPVCANLYDYPWNNYLWWPVRLTSGDGTEWTGWLAESTIGPAGEVTVLLYPD